MHLESQPVSPLHFMAAAGENVPTGAAGGNDSSVTIEQLRVLIVEDEGLVAMNMEAALAEAGFKVLGTVDTETDAIAAAIRQQPDVIILDITLREGDGISAALAISENIRSHIVFVSGNSDPQTLAMVDTMKNAGFIRKPFITDQFASQVLEIIGRNSDWKNRFS